MNDAKYTDTSQATERIDEASLLCLPVVKPRDSNARCHSDFGTGEVGKKPGIDPGPKSAASLKRGITCLDPLPLYSIYIQIIMARPAGAK